jgi:ubiquinone/menaquinone biosynthesis C-methylase UbiE
VFHPKGPTLVELARQALSSTEHGYDLLASKFDYTPFRTPDPIVHEIARRIGPVRAALDVCCGTGAALRALALGDASPGRLVGLDGSAGMLEEAAKHVPPHVELVRGDALDMPFRNEFDAVVCVGALGHIAVRDEPRFVTSIHHALVPGGRFLFATSELPPWTTTARLYAEAFNAVMRVRNVVWSPPFVMYYLTFLWPDVRGRLLAAGFTDVEVIRGAFPEPYDSALLVIARN